DGEAGEVALLADGEAERGVEAGGVDDGGVRAAVAGVGQPRLDVGRAGPVAPLARDAEGDVGVEVPGAFGEAGRPVVARHALEGDGPLEAVVLLRVPRAEVPDRPLDVPRQRHLCDVATRAARADGHEVGARGVAGADDVAGGVEALVAGGVRPELPL